MKRKIIYTGILKISSIKPQGYPTDFSIYSMISIAPN